MTPAGAGAHAWACLGLVASVIAACVGLPPPPPTEGPPGLASTGEVGTTDASSSDGGASTAASECGNGAIDPGEQCDTDLAAEATCESFGFLDGELGCTSCRLDAAGCAPPPGMVLVPAGAFVMGSEAMTDEQPIRDVTLGAYWIDETEVTVAAYGECVDAGICDTPPTGADFNYAVVGRDQHPVNGVNWYDADVYCRWVDEGSKRLPTEAEWERAARGTIGFAYPWGNALADCERVVMADAMGVAGCGTGTTAAVGSKPLGVSTVGALDMAGNVQEWVSDWYGDYDPTATQDPMGPSTGEYRMLRGGAWDDMDSASVRSAGRNFDDPADHTDTVGFRCVRTTMVELPG